MGISASGLPITPGAEFDDNGVAQIQEYFWDSTTSVAALLGKSDQMKTDIRNFYQQTVRPSVESYFADKPLGKEATFPLDGLYDVPHTSDTTTSPGWVQKTTVAFRDSRLTPGDFFGLDAFGTVGRGRLLHHRAQFTVKKEKISIPSGYDPDGMPTYMVVENLSVIQVHALGEITDLYDWNHDVLGTLGSAQSAAILQVGVGNGSYLGRMQSRIYQDRISFNLNYDSLP